MPKIITYKEKDCFIHRLCGLTKLLFFILSCTSCFFVLRKSYFTGMVSNSRGDFVIVFSLGDEKGRHNIKFYDNSGMLLNETVMNSVGGIGIKADYDLFIISNISNGSGYAFDRSGKQMHIIDYVETAEDMPRSIDTEKCTVTYSRDILGDEHFVCVSDSGTHKVDVGYAQYRKLKMPRVIVCLAVSAAVSASVMIIISLIQRKTASTKGES